MILTCKKCGKDFEKPAGKRGPQKFCDPKCGWEDKPCEVCKVPFFGAPDRKVCGEEGRREYLRIKMRTRNQTDIENQSRAGKLGGAARAAQLYGTTRADVYIKKDGAHVHRTVAEALLGRKMNRGEVVHHEDQDRHNNSPGNLIVFPSQAMHARHHKLGHCLQDSCDCTGIRLKELIK